VVNVFNATEIAVYYYALDTLYATGVYVPTATKIHYVDEPLKA